MAVAPMSAVASRPRLVIAAAAALLVVLYAGGYAVYRHATQRVLVMEAPHGTTQFMLVMDDDVGGRSCYLTFLPVLLVEGWYTGRRVVTVEEAQAIGLVGL